MAAEMTTLESVRAWQKELEQLNINDPRCKWCEIRRSEHGAIGSPRCDGFEASSRT